MSVDGTSAYWRAVGLLRLDRSDGLSRLAECFATGSVAGALDRPLRGRLLATTVGHGLDGVIEATTRLWMPWLGKTFDEAAGVLRNVFTAGAGRIMRFTMPRYHDLREEGMRQTSAFAFRTSTGPSALDPAVEVLRIDYRDVVDNPAWPIQRVLEQLVAVDDGLYLGQAPLDWRGSLRRAAWFSLET